MWLIKIFYKKTCAYYCNPTKGEMQFLPHDVVPPSQNYNNNDYVPMD